jgi:hypothetical protein
MKDITDKNFGPLIAFCLPGFILLLGLSRSFPEVKEWLELSASKDGASIGGFLYATLASLSLGLLLSAIRWATVDWFFHLVCRIGRSPLPQIAFAELDNKDKLAAFLGVIDAHYRYFQYYSNSLVAVELAGISYLWKVGRPSNLQLILAVALVCILALASLDCYRKFYIRGAAVTTRKVGNDERLGTPGDRQAEASEDGQEGEEAEERGKEDSEKDSEVGKEKEVV